MSILLRDKLQKNMHIIISFVYIWNIGKHKPHCLGTHIKVQKQRVARYWLLQQMGECLTLKVMKWIAGILACWQCSVSWRGWWPQGCLIYLYCFNHCYQKYWKCRMSGFTQTCILTDPQVIPVRMKLKKHCCDIYMYFMHFFWRRDTSKNFKKYGPSFFRFHQTITGTAVYSCCNSSHIYSIVILLLLSIYVPDTRITSLNLKAISQ